MYSTQTTCVYANGEASYTSHQHSFFQLNAQCLTKSESQVLGLFCRRYSKELTQTGDVNLFKESLQHILESFIPRIGNDETKKAILAFQNELQNQNLLEISKKYFQNDTQGTFTEQLAPFLGKNSNIQNLAAQEGDQIRAKLVNDFAFKALNRDSLMSLFVEYKKGKRDSFKCNVIDINDLPACLGVFINTMEFSKLNLMVRSGVHYTAVILERGEEGVQAAILDAAGDKSYMTIDEICEEAGCKSIYILGAKDVIQFDRFNCAFFTFDTIWQAFKHPNFFAYLKELPSEVKNGRQLLFWNELASFFVRNATSLSFMNNYHATNPASQDSYKGCVNFKDYVDGFIELRNIGGTQRKAHTVLENRVTKQQLKITKMFDALSDEQLIAAINNNLAGALLA
jgi:hypothetical protein